LKISDLFEPRVGLSEGLKYNIRWYARFFKTGRDSKIVNSKVLDYKLDYITNKKTQIAYFREQHYFFDQQSYDDQQIELFLEKTPVQLVWGYQR